MLDLSKVVDAIERVLSSRTEAGSLAKQNMTIVDQRVRMRSSKCVEFCRLYWH